jgi:lysophospholipase L1-like esterase
MVRRRLFTATVVLCAVVFGLVSSEWYLYSAGYGSYPIYDVDHEIKYIPAANQHGRFLNRNAWYFNDRHMGNKANWDPAKHPDVLLVGNSIVLGGNPFNHDDKLGPLLEKDLGGGATVWSAAAGGWSNVNEMVYLDRNADVLQNADAVIIEYMEGGLSAPNPWPGYYVFPDRKGLSLTSYAIGKYVVRPLLGRVTTDFGSLPATGATDPAQLLRFKTLVSTIAKDHKLVIFMYPMLKNLRNKPGWLAAIAPIQEICRDFALTCIDVAQEPNWTEGAYSADGVHPTVSGNKTLASILANALR